MLENKASKFFDKHGKISMSNSNIRMIKFENKKTHVRKMVCSSQSKSHFESNQIIWRKTSTEVKSTWTLGQNAFFEVPFFRHFGRTVLYLKKNTFANKIIAAVDGHNRLLPTCETSSLSDLPRLPQKEFLITNRLNFFAEIVLRWHQNVEEFEIFDDSFW